MAGNFRVSFTDIDSSIGVNSNDTPIKGYMVVRAPKGNAYPTYFPAGSTNKILSLVGVPSTKYPHIQDAIDFNTQFGLWISAPPGTSSDYPSYFGGKYLTDLGFFDFDKVTDKDNPNFLARLLVGTETSLGAPSNVTVTRNLSTGEITITGITSHLYNLLYGLRFNYRGAGLYQGAEANIVLNKSNGNLMIGSEIVGTITESSGTWTVTLPGTNIAVPYFNFAMSGSANAYFDTHFPSNFILNWILDIDEITYLYFVQRSPTEEKSFLNIQDIGYIQSFTVSGSTFTCNDHRLKVNDTVRVRTSGTLPGGLQGNTTYYVVSATSNTFSLSLTRSGVPISVSSSGTGTHFVYKEDLPENMIRFSVSETVLPGQTVSNGPYVGSLLVESKDSFGSPNFIELRVPVDSNPFVEVRVVRPFTGPVQNKVDFTIYEISGQRYAAQDFADLAVVLQSGWDAAQDDDFESVNLFMDPSGIPSLKSSLAGLRSNYHKLSTYISPILGNSPGELLDNRSSAPNVTGLAYYANRFLRRENYTGTSFWSSCIGAIGTKLAKIMQDKFGGWAPMYTDRSGLGGSLPISVEKQEFKFTSDQQQEFDRAGLNLIIKDSYHGPMIIGQKTAQSPSQLSDWSYLCHSMAFDLLKREIRDKVLIPQIGKPNNEEYQTICQVQAEAIVNRRISGSNKIWSSAIVDAYSGNDAAAKMARKFVLIIKVKVTVFSEFVNLTLQTVGQNVEL